ncbi:beta-lactamase class A [Arenibacter nanhaiticus]|uniref:beta-lactamase n=1 Tax=Arenibacter nanhaiticus TaxID=558155 RepID=A0A1M6J4H0_9FLAO|nr:beta-lactamase class A [Arenibacter nanhaiticus]
MRSLFFIFFVCFLFLCPLWAQKALPLRLDEADLKPLRSLEHTLLQRNLEKELMANARWKYLMNQKKMAVGIVDLRNPQQAKFASINGAHMMYAASLPKIAILLSSMDAIEKGELQETDEIKRDMRLMISKSNNQASTRMIDRLGYDKIASVMTDPQYKFYDKSRGGGLWVGKRYGGGGDTNREPLKNLSHAATVNQVCRYYYMLVNGKLVNNQRSKQMLDIMGEPELHHKFVNTLDQIAPTAKLFRKSGSWKNFHSDSVLVWGKNPSRRYILVALVDDPNGDEIIRSLVRPIEKVLKNTVNTVALN